MANSSVFNLSAFTALAAADVLPAVDVSDATQSAQGSLLKITITNFFASIPAPVNVTSASATSLAVGRLGATTPAFTVDSSTASQVAGLKVTGAATGGTVAVVVTDSGSNANLTLNAKGSGTVLIGNISTGGVRAGGVASTTVPSFVVSDGTAFPSGALTSSGAEIAAAQTVASLGVRWTGVTGGGATSFRGVAAVGTIGSPTALTNNTTIVQLTAGGYDGSAWQGVDTNGNVAIQAAGTWTGASRPTKILLATTAVGATSQTTAVTIGSDQSLSAAGGVIVTGGAFAAGAVYKSATLGLSLGAITGSSTDFTLSNPSGGSTILDVLTGTTNVRIPNGSLTTADPTGGAGAWKLGIANAVSPTSPNRTITVDIGGTLYYIHAKTTNN